MNEVIHKDANDTAAAAIAERNITLDELFTDPKAAIQPVREALLKRIAKRRPITLSEPLAEPEAARKTTTPCSPDIRIIARRASDIQIRELEWLWERRFPMRKLNMLVGHPETNKSTLSWDMASRITTGRMWPDGAPGITGNAIIISGEDDPEDTIVPRLLAAGADLDRIKIIDEVQYVDTETNTIHFDALALDRHIEPLRRLLIENECRLFILDPISSFTGRIDDHKNNEVRMMLSALAKVAQEVNCCILAISHLRKQGGTAIHATIGSLAYSAAARTSWLMSKDNEDPDRRLLVRIKGNLARRESGLACRVVASDLNSDYCVLHWESDPVELSADEVLSGTGPGRPAVERDEAVEWLSVALVDGPQPVPKLLAAARADGIAVHTLRNAKSVLGVEAKKDDFDQGWTWFLPTHRH